MWECQFTKMLPKIQNVPTPLIPDILCQKQTEENLLNSIKLGRIFGFILCDVESPPHVIKNYQDFPPIIRRETITDELLSSYMSQKIKLEKPDLIKFSRKTLIQCFTAENHLLLSTVAAYYMTKGIILKNVKQFIQYIPRKVLNPFAEHVTKMRIAAEKENNPTKSATAKIFGNSGYGKVTYYLTFIV